MKRVVAFLASLILIGFVPLLTTAALVPDCGSGPCDFNKLNDLYENVSHFLLWDILAPLSVLAIAFVGIQYLTALGNPGKLEKVHETAKDILWGIVVALAAYGVVAAIFKVLYVGGNVPKVGS